MEVLVRGEPRDICVSTITLQPEHTKNMYSFHCINCGDGMETITGKVSKIYPILEPSSDVTVVRRCRKCGKRYVYQTYDGYSTTKVRVILHYENNLRDESPKNVFRCYKEPMNFGKILLYDDKSIMSYVDNKPKKVPFTSPCVNPVCDIVYNFVQLV